MPAISPPPASNSSSNSTPPTNRFTEVLLNSDLLNSVLRHMSSTDLFYHARYVHPTWYALISSSKSLQDIIHYRSSPPRWPSQPRFNPILQRAFPMFFQSLAWVDVFSFTFPERTIRPEALICPTANFRDMPVIIGLSNQLTRIDIIEEGIERLGYRQRNGHLPFPPPAALDSTSHRNDEEGGLTMGKLVDLCLGWCATTPKTASFVIRWRQDLLERSVNPDSPSSEILSGSQQQSSATGLWSMLANLFSFGKWSPVHSPLSQTRTAFDHSYQDSQRVHPLMNYALDERYDTLMKVVLFNVENSFPWFTDILDEEAVVPEEWQGCKGKFEPLMDSLECSGGLARGTVGGCPYTCAVHSPGAATIVHPIRMPRKTRKWREVMDGVRGS